MLRGAFLKNLFNFQRKSFFPKCTKKKKKEKKKKKRIQRNES